MHNRFLQLYRVAVYSLAAILLAGCYSVHQGQFVAEKISGWSVRQAAGASYFQYPIKKAPDWYISIGCIKSGTLHLIIGVSGEYDPHALWTSKMLSFSEDPVRVVFHDTGGEAIIPSDGFRTLFGQDIEIGNSQNFTVFVPAFKIGDNAVPELVAHFHWSNGKYRIWHNDLM